MTRPAGAHDEPIRTVVTDRDIAARLELRILPDDDPGVLEARCALAAQERVAALLCPPELVADAVRLLEGSGVPVGTGLAMRERVGRGFPVAQLVEEAERAADLGAVEVGLKVNCSGPDRMDLTEACDWVEAVQEVARRRDLRVRVLIETEGASHAELATWCLTLAGMGIYLVHGGTWSGPRAGFDQIRVMRDALPGVLLKWTYPVRSLNMLLLCMAEGIDRFNGEAATLVHEARRRGRVAPLELPVPGHDY